MVGSYTVVQNQPKHSPGITAFKSDLVVGWTMLHYRMIEYFSSKLKISLIISNKPEADISNLLCKYDDFHLTNRKSMVLKRCLESRMNKNPELTSIPQIKINESLE